MQRSFEIGREETGNAKGKKNNLLFEPHCFQDKSDKTSKLIRPTPKLPSDRPLTEVADNDSITKAPKRAQNNGKRYKVYYKPYKALIGYDSNRMGN